MNVKVLGLAGFVFGALLILMLWFCTPIAEIRSQPYGEFKFWTGYALVAIPDGIAFALIFAFPAYRPRLRLVEA
jgi:hypothetical protein